MLGARLGPYTLLAELGSGGMGTVWRATGPDGATVAVKVVHAHLLRAGDFRERFEREARTGMAVAHANVVRTIECLDVERDGERVPALVLEYVEGRDLSALLRESGRVPEDLCRHLGHEIASGLAAIHAAGIVHRDLKPGNVLVTPDHRVKVMDLGLARRASGDDRLSATGVFVGTAAYAPPEQFLGTATLDPRSDLWSLGAMLYELATGRVPFGGASIGEIVRKVLHDAPEPPGRLAPQLSPFFEEVLLALLRKRPEDRPGSAAELAAILRDGEAGAWWARAATRVVAATRRPLRRIRIPRESAVWGREDDLSDLRARWARARAGDGQVVLLEGEAGIGKSRLVDEFLAALGADDVRVLVAPCPPGGGAGGLAAAFAEHFGRDDDAIRRALADTPALVPAFAALLRGDGPPPGCEPLRAQSLATAFVRAARSIAAEGPLVLLVEDLHFAPDEERRVFAALAHAVPGHRVLLLGTARPGLPAAWYAEMERRGHVAKREVRRLDERTVRAGLTELLGSTSHAERLASRIAAKADGNPFFVFELLRALRESGVVSRADDGRWSVARDAEVEVPSSVRDLVAARLENLGADDREVLEAAACQGAEFDGRLVAAALGRPRLDVLRRLGRLERGTALVRAAGPRFAFDHHLVHEVLYEATSPALREELHAATAEAIERQHGLPAKEPRELPGDVVTELARHLLLGGCGERAPGPIRAAIVWLTARSAANDVVALTERALAAPSFPGGAARVDVLVERTDALERVGRYAEAVASAEEACALAEALGDPRRRADALRGLAWMLLLVVRTDEALRAAEASLEAARALGEPRREILAARVHCVIASERGMPVDEAVACLESLATRARAAGMRPLDAELLSDLGRLHLAAGRFERALEFQERRLALSIERGSLYGRAVAAINAGSALANLRRYPEAAARFAEAAEAARAGGLRAMEHSARGNLSQLEDIAGDRGRRLERAHERLREARELGLRDDEYYAVTNLGVAEWFLGRLSESLGHLSEALDLARGGRGGNVSHACVNLADVRYLVGDRDAAVAGWREALGIAEARGGPVAQILALRGLAAAAVDAADVDAATEIRDRLVAAAADCGDPAAASGARVAAADVDLAAGRPADAAALLAEARATAERASLWEPLVLAECGLVRAGAGDVARAEAALRSHEADLPVELRMRAHWALRDANGGHAQEARRLLDLLVESAPEGCRRAMRESVRLHREILASAPEGGSAPK